MTFFKPERIRIGVFLYASLIILTSFVSAQKEDKVVVVGKYLSFSSEILQEDFTYLEHLPAGYEKSAKKYPVVFVLNSQIVSTFAIASATLDRLSFEQIPEMILIGISNTGRARNYFPIRPNTNTTGEADTFLKFLKEELIPYVDNKYRTESYRILMGQSNTGLFVVYALLADPAIFNAYIAASPALGWGLEFMQKKAESAFASQTMPSRFLYMNYGEFDYPRLVNNALPGFIKILEDKAPSALTWKVEYLKNEGHVPVATLNNALLTLFADYRISDDIKAQGLNAVDQYYAGLTKKFGFELTAPEEILFNMAYRLKQSKQPSRAIRMFKVIQERYPMSWRGHFFLGETYQETGNLEEAVKCFEKTLEVNPELEAAKRKLAEIRRK